MASIPAVLVYTCGVDHGWTLGNAGFCPCGKPILPPEEAKLYNEDPLKWLQQDTERDRAVKIVMDLFYALREIDGQPTLKDLVKLAKRIRG